MRLFSDAAHRATTFLPTKRLFSSLLFCVLFFCFIFGPVSVQAESNNNDSILDKTSPVAAHQSRPDGSVLSKIFFDLGFDFWRAPPEKIAPVHSATQTTVTPSLADVTQPAAASTVGPSNPALPKQSFLPDHSPVPQTAALPSLSITNKPPAATPEVVLEKKLPALPVSLQSTTELPGIPLLPLEVNDAIPQLNSIDLITPPDDLWQRVRNGFSMANLDSPLVAERQAWYLNRPELLKSLLNRSRRYLFYIVGELERRGMPTELALLPMVESSYNPMAYSPARASGLWQFIPSTGKNYRLQQDWWQDQRRDVIASTGAALNYLQNIYEMHGDWHLALASYNWGEAAVARAIAKNQAKHLPTDYLSINMPQETRHYVPKLQALKNIIAQPKLFGIKIDPIPNQPYFDTVSKTSNMDVTVAAQLAEVPLNEFLALNPSYNRPVMPGGNGSPIILPADKVQTFLSNLERHEADEKPLSNWTTYTLKKGERLDKVAARYGMSLTRLKQINGIGPRVRVHAGNRLLVPGKSLQLAEDELPEVNLPQEAPPVTKKPKQRSAQKQNIRTKKATQSRGKVTRATPSPSRPRHSSGKKRHGKR